MASADFLCMNKQILQKIKKDLEGKRRKVAQELKSIARKDPKVQGDYDTRFPDFGTPQSTDESALEVAAYESTLPIEYALEIKLQRINKALEKIEKGEYGKCEKCDKIIDEKRLQAIPEAENCAKCQK